MHEVDQPTLFRLAVTGLSLTAVWEHGRGWKLLVQHRHAGCKWGACPSETYHQLSTDELVDVVSSAVASVLE